MRHSQSWPVKSANGGMRISARRTPVQVLSALLILDEDQGRRAEALGQELPAGTAGAAAHGCLNGSGVALCVTAELRRCQSQAQGAPNTPAACERAGERAGVRAGGSARRIASSFPASLPQNMSRWDT